MDDSQENLIIKEALDFYGSDLQITVAIEELSELIHALCRERRITQINPARGSTFIEAMSIAEEIADVEICLEYLKEIFRNHEKPRCRFDEAGINFIKQKKLIRLKERITHIKTTQSLRN